MLNRLIKFFILSTAVLAAFLSGAAVLSVPVQASSHASLPSYFHWGTTSDHHNGQPCMVVWASKRTKRSTVELCKGGFHTHAVRIATSSFVRPRGTACQTGETCFYPRTDTNGSVVTVANSGSHGFWFNLCNVTAECQPLSVWENGGSCLWLYTNSTHDVEVEEAGGVDEDTGDRYDWAYIKYGTSNCGQNPPRPLP
jgi:hypothetical protein